jgi:hypothetical protein
MLSEGVFAEMTSQEQRTLGQGLRKMQQHAQGQLHCHNVFVKKRCTHKATCAKATQVTRRYSKAGQLTRLT